MALDLRKIKSLFVVEDESQQQKKQTTESEKLASTNSKASSELSSYIPSDMVRGQSTAKFMKVLHGAMENQNLPGVDYLEYKQSLKSLEKMPMDESVRYQSAYAMAQAMGATPSKLISSASHYLEVLKNEAAKFQQAVQNQRREQNEKRQEAINALEKSLQDKAKQIKKLTAEMEKHRAESAKLTAQIKTASEKVESAQANFQATYSSLNAQISSDVENMKKYLK